EVLRRAVRLAHKLLGEPLAGLDLGRGARGPEYPQVFLLKRVDDALGQRLFGPHHGQADVFFPDETNQALEIVRFHRYVDTVLGRPGISRRTIDALDARRLGQLPDQGMFATALTDAEDLHVSLPSNIPYRSSYER